MIKLLIIVAVVCLLAAIYLPSYEFSTGLQDTFLGSNGNSHISTKEMLAIISCASLGTILVATMSFILSCDYG
jgi:hypothetical protein